MDLQVNPLCKRMAGCSSSLGSRNSIYGLHWSCIDCMDHHKACQIIQPRIESLIRDILWFYFVLYSYIYICIYVDLNAFLCVMYVIEKGV